MSEELSQQEIDEDVEIFYNISDNKSIARLATERYKSLLKLKDCSPKESFDSIIDYIHESNRLN